MSEVKSEKVVEKKSLIAQLAICEGLTPEQKEERIAKYGYDNWYDWRFENWGGKLNAQE